MNNKLVSSFIFISPYKRFYGSLRDFAEINKTCLVGVSNNKYARDSKVSGDAPDEVEFIKIDYDCWVLLAGACAHAKLDPGSDAIVLLAISV